MLLTLAKINIKRCSRFITFCAINLHRLIKPSGVFIALIGLDGCGKTTILEKLNDFFKNSFITGKDKTFYWRPFLLPRIRYLLKLTNQNTSNSEINNHDSKLLKRTYLHSILYLCKFLYYLVDFILGRVRYQAAWSRGGIVCFDRYYYDQLIYPQRFNFIVPRFIMSLCMQLVPKPEIVFFLDAPPELLYHRKRELSLEELNHQREDYLNLMEKLKNCHRIDTTTSFKETLDTIITECLNYMAKRIKLKY